MYFIYSNNLLLYFSLNLFINLNDLGVNYTLINHQNFPIESIVNYFINY